MCKTPPNYCSPLSTSYSLPSLLGCQVPNKPSSASYSFSARRRVGAPSEDLSMSPGPGKYNSTNPDIYRQRQPSFSMQSRTKRPDYSSATPGPGMYSPEKYYLHLPKPPSFTLGVRHSEFVTPLVVHVADWRFSGFISDALFFIDFFFFTYPSQSRTCPNVCGILSFPVCMFEVWPCLLVF